MNRNKGCGLLAVLLLAAASGWAAPLPTSLAGNRLGALHVKLTPAVDGGGTDDGDAASCPLNDSKIFDVIMCSATPNTKKLWKIEAVYDDDTVPFDVLLAVRQKRYGPPARVSQDTEDCIGSIEANTEATMAGLGLVDDEHRCAIWENATITMILDEKIEHLTYTRSGRPKTYHTYQLILISNPLMGQDQQEADQNE